jgi:uncharacterized protein (DUF983 family)
MYSRKTTIIIFWRGLRLRCPACGLGALFDHPYRLQSHCPYCHSRYERASGESVGAIYMNTIITLILAVIGFFVTDSLWNPPVVLQLILWGGFTLSFPLLTYHFMRGLWISIAHLGGSVYPDPDYEREWVAEEQPLRQTGQPKDEQ